MPKSHPHASRKHEGNSGEAEPDGPQIRGHRVHHGGRYQEPYLKLSFTKKSEKEEVSPPVPSLDLNQNTGYCPARAGKVFL